MFFKERTLLLQRFFQSFFILAFHVHLDKARLIRVKINNAVIHDFLLHIRFYILII